MAAGRPLRIVVLVTLLCFLSACSSTTRVPASDFSKVEPGKRVVLDVKTVDAHYRVTRFSVNDSTLVIEDAMTGGDTYPSSHGWSKPPSLPYALPLGQITSMQRIEESHPVAGMFGGMTLFVGIIVIAVAILVSQADFGAMD